MKCANCGLSIIKVLNRGDWEWVHYWADHTCGKPEPTEPKAILVTSEALMFAEQSVPWPDERPYEKTLAPDELED